MTKRRMSRRDFQRLFPRKKGQPHPEKQITAGLRPGPHGEKTSGPSHPHAKTAFRPPQGGHVSPHAETVEGKLSLKGKFGFVISEKPGVPDTYIQGPTLRLAMNGDRVAARSTSSSGNRPEGEIVSVVQRARANVVGVFRKTAQGGVLAPEDGSENVRLLDMKGLAPQEGDLVVAKITRWPTMESQAGGALIEVLGPRTSPEVDLRALLHKYELPETFSPIVQSESESFGRQVPEEALRGRETFFHIPVFTIDGADAKDFDDAVSLEARPDGGRRLGVHIADVSHYVTEGRALDEEAYLRGTSVYLMGTVVPMLPFPLSDGLCSLRADVVRLTLSCLMELDGQGRVVSQKIVESAIRSAKRFTYEEVEEILKGGTSPSTPADVAETVKSMGKLARQLRTIRFKRGSLDFDFPESRLIEDAAGRPVDVVRKERLESHRLIEEFMLLANETVATAMSKVPFLYRVHERPDDAKMEKLEQMLKTAGVAVPHGFREGRPMALQGVLESVKQSPVEPMIHMMVLRSLKQAVYSPNNEGHFGLASACYTHFTSPIRRYPDLIVHRIVKEHRHRALTPERQEHWKKYLPPAALWTSQRERVASDAERELLDLKKVQVMEKRIGESFDGVVSSVTSFGFFVQLDEVFVEGLVHISNLRDDYYIYDEIRSTLRGRRTGRVLRMGQKVRVKLAAANTAKRQLDFELEETPPKGQKPHGHPAQGRNPKSPNPQSHNPSPRHPQGQNPHAHNRHHRHRGP
jgi:ribonuclease R